MKEIYKELIKLEIPEKYRKDIDKSSKPKKEIDFTDQALIDFS